MSVDPTLGQLVEAIRGLEADEVTEILRRSPGLASAYHEPSFGSTPLIHAVMTDDRTMVDLVLAAGADIDQRSDWWAGSFGVLDQASDEMSAYLLERGATLTPHAAARLGMIEELRAMIACDPTCVHERGGDGQRPLHFARTPEVVDLLLDAGAEIDALDVDHESTPAQWQATRRPTVASYLMDRGAVADPFLAAATGRIDMLERVAADDAQVVHATVSHARFKTRGERAAEHIYFYTFGGGASLVHAAALTDQAGVIRWLVAAGADVNVRGGYDDQTPLHAAAWNGSIDALDALADCGADLSAESGCVHHTDPLTWAIVSGASSSVRALVARGATIAPSHRKEADRGVAGEFRQFNRERPPEAWTEIQELLRDV